jgi:outer membrane cobalamin receptor
MRLATRKIIFGWMLSTILIRASIAEEDYFSMTLDDLLNTEITVASTKSSSMLKAVSSVTVIDRKMINDYGFLSVSEALKTVSGFESYRTYLKQNLPTGRGVLQDHYANKVLVMINGIPSWHAVTGEGNLDRIDIKSVERIEILKGPASVLYGTQAYSGAINIVLKKPSEAGQAGKVHVGGGNNGAYAAGGYWLLKADNNISISASANIREEDGNSIAFTDETGVTDDIREYVSSRNVTFDITYGEHTVLLNGFEVDESYLGVIPRHANGAGNNHDVDGILTAYSWRHNWSDTTRTDLKLYYDENERNLSRSADDSIRANILGRRYGASLKNNVDLSDQVSIEVGGDYDFRKSEEYSNYQNGTFIADNNLQNRHMYEYSGFLQADYAVSDWRFLAGTRYTENELFGDNVSSRGTVSYQLDEDSSLKFIFGQSFRAPSLFELYFITPENTVFGSENLSPEKSTSGELSYQTVVGNCYVQAILYRAEYDGIISREIDTVTLADGTVYDDVNVYDNGGKFHVNGAEIELKYIIPEIMNLFLNADYIYDDDDSQADTQDHSVFMHSPTFTSTFGIQKTLGSFSAATMVSYLDNTKGHEEEVNSSTKVDLSFSYTTKVCDAKARHSLAVRNLFDVESSFPEYVRGKGLNAVPMDTGLSIFYTFEIEL